MKRQALLILSCFLLAIIFPSNPFIEQSAAEDGIRDRLRSRGLGDVYKRQGQASDLASILHDLQKKWPETIDTSLVFASRLLDSWLRTGHLAESTD